MTYSNILLLCEQHLWQNLSYCRNGRPRKSKHTQTL